MMDPTQNREGPEVDFVRQLHEALLPREQLGASSWNPKDGSPWSGPAISELLKQFIAHNRMVTGGFAISS